MASAPSEAVFIFGWLLALVLMVGYNCIYGNRCGLRRHPVDVAYDNARRQAEANQTAPPTTSVVSTAAAATLSRKDRKEYVENVLKTEKFVKSVEVAEKEEETESPNCCEESLSENMSTTSCDDDEDDGSCSSSQQQQSCAICIEKFRNGDDICFSHNVNCHHHFHRNCIVEWLLTHDDCPCCRRNYLGFEEEEESSGDGEVEDLEAGRHQQSTTTATTTSIEA